MMVSKIAGAIVVAGVGFVAPTEMLAADVSVRTVSPARVYATGRDLGRCTYFDFIGRPQRVFTNEYSCNIFYRSNLAAGYSVMWQPGWHHVRRHRL